MAKGYYIGDSTNKARKVKKMYVGDITGKARKVKKVYIGDTNGKARLAWSSSIKALACSSRESLIYSTDLQTWINSNTSMNDTYIRGTFGNDRFVFMSTKKSLFSSDGIVWNVGAATDFYASTLEYIDGEFIAYKGGMTQDQGIYFSSKDGITWESNNYTYSIYMTFSGSPNRVIKVGNMYIMVGAYSSGSTTGGFIFTSTDNKIWSLAMNINNNECVDITYGNGKYLAAFYVPGSDFGGVAYSTDAKKWTYVDLNTAVIKVRYGNGVFVGIMDTGLRYSYDGINWTMAFNLYNITWLEDIIFTGERFYCVGNGGYSYYSVNGIEWIKMEGLPSDGANLVYSIDGGGRQ